MRTSFLILLLTIPGYSANADTVTAIRSGSWGAPSTWSCHCVPASSNEITIPENITVTIPGTVTLLRKNLVTLTVNGTLDLHGASLYLNSEDQIITGPAGKIVTSMSSIAAVYFGNIPVYVTKIQPVASSRNISMGKWPSELVKLRVRCDTDSVFISMASLNEQVIAAVATEISIDGINFQKPESMRTLIRDTDAKIKGALPLKGMGYYRISFSILEEKYSFTIMAYPRGNRKVTF